MPLRIQGLRVCAGSRQVLAINDVQISAGTFVAILGPNGVGKSTLLNVLSGVRPCALGQLFWHNQDLSAISRKERAQTIAAIGQSDLAPLDTLVHARVSHGLYARHGLKIDKTAAEKLERIKEEFALGPFWHKPLRLLSGGEKKRVHLARALVDHEAAIYLLDEPEASLDSNYAHLLMRSLAQRARQGKLVIATLHHTVLAHEFAHQIWRLPGKPTLNQGIML